MAYNTGNALGSSDVRDLSDNAKNLDFFANGPAASYVDRFGTPRKSVAQMNAEYLAAQVYRANEFIATQNAKQAAFDAAQLARANEYSTDKSSRDTEFASDQAERVDDFRDFLESSGYEVPVDYSTGLAITRPTQTIRYLGELYRAKDASLPFTTTNWATDTPKLFAIGDAALRQELATPTGSSKSGWWNTTVKDRLDQTLSLKAMGALGVDDTAILVDAFSRTNVRIDTGKVGDVCRLRHDTLLTLTGKKFLEIKSGVSVIGTGRIEILSNLEADGTRLEIIGDRCYVGPCEIAEINTTLMRANFYGPLCAKGAINFAIDRTRVIGANGAAVHIRNNSQNFVIRGLYIRNAKADGLHIQRGSRDFYIDGADIRQVEDDCIGIVGHGKNEGFSAPRNGTIVGGYYGDQQNGAVGSGIALIGCHSIQVLQPIIRNTGLSGIRIAEETSQGLLTPRNITVVGADIDRTGLTTNPGGSLSKEGIFISAGYKIKIVSPTISRAGTHGISISGPNVDVVITNPDIQLSGGRGLWVSGGTATGDFITEIWGDDARGVGAVSVKNEYMKFSNGTIDRSTNDGAYIDGTAGSLVEPTVQHLKVRRSNMGNTANKYGIFLKDASSVVFVDFDGGVSGSGTALLSGLQFSGAVTFGTNGRIDKMRTRFASLTIPLEMKYGLREFWNSAAPSVATGVEGGYKLAEIVRNVNPATGVVYWVCTVAGDPGTWAAK